MRLLKNKMAQYGNVDASMLDVISKHESLLNSQENREFAELKVVIQQLQREMQIMKQRHSIKLDDKKRQEKYLVE